MNLSSLHLVCGGRSHLDYKLLIGRSKFNCIVGSKRGVTNLTRERLVSVVIIQRKIKIRTAVWKPVTMNIVVFEDVTRETNVTSPRTSIYIYQHWKHYYVYQFTSYNLRQDRYIGLGIIGNHYFARCRKIIQGHVRACDITKSKSMVQQTYMYLCLNQGCVKFIMI